MSQPDELRRLADEFPQQMMVTVDKVTLRAAADRIERLEAQQAAALALPRRIYEWLLETNPDMDESSFTEAHTLVTVFEAGGPEAWEAEMTAVEADIARRALTEDTP